MIVTIPDTPTRPQQEILITLRALAGLVAEAIGRTAASGDEATFARENARLTFWRSFLLHHTRRLLPAVVGGADDLTCRAFADQLVHEVYREDRAASGDGLVAE